MRVPIARATILGIFHGSGIWRDHFKTTGWGGGRAGGVNPDEEGVGLVAYAMVVRDKQLQNNSQFYNAKSIQRFNVFKYM